MRTIHSLLDEYGESHQNPTNKTIHWICVPLIVISLIGLLWSIPVPEQIKTFGPFANFGTVFILLAMVYYTMLSIPLTIGMLGVGAAFLAVNYGLSAAFGSWHWLASLLIFTGAWVGQFIGHKIEGKKPSFFKDLQFLLIGPLWLLHFIYRNAGVRF